MEQHNLSHYLWSLSFFFLLNTGCFFYFFSYLHLSKWPFSNRSQHRKEKRERSWIIRQKRSITNDVPWISDDEENMDKIWNVFRPHISIDHLWSDFLGCMLMPGLNRVYVILTSILSKMGRRIKVNFSLSVWKTSMLYHLSSECLKADCWCPFSLKYPSCPRAKLSAAMASCVVCYADGDKKVSFIIIRWPHSCSFMGEGTLPTA